MFLSRILLFLLYTEIKRRIWDVFSMSAVYSKNTFYWPKLPRFNLTNLVRREIGQGESKILIFPLPCPLPFKWTWLLVRQILTGLISGNTWAWRTCYTHCCRLFGQGWAPGGNYQGLGEGSQGCHHYHHHHHTRHPVHLYQCPTGSCLSPMDSCPLNPDVRHHHCRADLKYNSLTWYKHYTGGKRKRSYTEWKSAFVWAKTDTLLFFCFFKV